MSACTCLTSQRSPFFHHLSILYNIFCVRCVSLCFSCNNAASASSFPSWQTSFCRKHLISPHLGQSKRLGGTTQRLRQSERGPRLSWLRHNGSDCARLVCECLETDVRGRGRIAGPWDPRQCGAPGKWPLALLAPLALRSIIPYVLDGEANAND